jgi:hypothetical protein
MSDVRKAGIVCVEVAVDGRSVDSSKSNGSVGKGSRAGSDSIIAANSVIVLVGLLKFLKIEI